MKQAKCNTKYMEHDDDSYKSDKAQPLKLDNFIKCNVSRGEQRGTLRLIISLSSDLK